MGWAQGHPLSWEPDPSSCPSEVTLSSTCGPGFHLHVPQADRRPSTCASKGIFHGILEAFLLTPALESSENNGCQRVKQVSLLEDSVDTLQSILLISKECAQDAQFLKFNCLWKLPSPGSQWIGEVLDFVISGARTSPVEGDI